MPEDPKTPPANAEAELRSMAHEMHSLVQEMRQVVRALNRTVQLPSLLISLAALVMASAGLWRVSFPSQTQEVHVERQPTPEELQDARIRDREGLP